MGGENKIKIAFLVIKFRNIKNKFQKSFTNNEIIKPNIVNKEATNAKIPFSCSINLIINLFIIAKICFLNGYNKNKHKLKNKKIIDGETVIMAITLNHPWVSFHAPMDDANNPIEVREG